MWKQIGKATAIAGSLDITAASIQAYLSSSVTPDRLLRYIASGLFGADAYSGGVEYMAIGLFVHFLIVFACAVTYFFTYPTIRFLHISSWLSSFLVALAAWIITTRVIIPVSQIKPAPFNATKVLIAVAILYGCIGLPITLIANNYYSKKRITR
jgi:hypothetical protein